MSRAELTALEKRVANDLRAFLSTKHLGLGTKDLTALACEAARVAVRASRHDESGPVVSSQPSTDVPDALGPDD